MESEFDGKGIFSTFTRFLTCDFNTHLRTYEKSNYLAKNDLESGTLRNE